LRRYGLILAAVALLALAAFLMAPPQKPRAVPREVEFPRYQRPHEIARQSARLRVPSARHRSDAGEPPGTPPEAGFDPVHVALAGGHVALVLEARVLRDSPIGRKLLGCLSPEHLDDLAQLKERLGFDPIERVERIGMTSSAADSEPVLVLSGDFRGVDLAFPDTDLPAFEPYGKRTRLAENDHQALALWDESIFVIGNTEPARAIIRRLEGEDPPLDPFPADEAYGEVYGGISGAALSELVPSEYRERVRDAAERVLLHVDATDDLLLVADVRGEPSQIRDLGTALGGALALGRLKAAKEDQALLGELLDQSRVVPGEGGFLLEMALPLAAIEEQLGACAQAPTGP
jgi:hypothetical protein